MNAKTVTVILAALLLSVSVAPIAYEPCDASTDGDTTRVNLTNGYILMITAPYYSSMEVRNCWMFISGSDNGTRFANQLENPDSCDLQAFLENYTDDKSKIESGDIVDYYAWYGEKTDEIRFSYLIDGYATGGGLTIVSTTYEVKAAYLGDKHAAYLIKPNTDFSLSVEYDGNKVSYTYGYEYGSITSGETKFFHTDKTATLKVYNPYYETVITADIEVTGASQPDGDSMPIMIVCIAIALVAAIVLVYAGLKPAWSK